MATKNWILLSGSQNQALAQKIAAHLNQPLGKIEFRIFPNQELQVRIKENITGKIAFIIHSLDNAPNDSLIEFLFLADAAKNAGAKKIIGVFPWLSYSPQDKIFRPGENWASKLTAQLIKTAGINEVILLDVHSPLNIKFFRNVNIKVHHLSALDIFIKEFKNKIQPKDWVVLCLDKGAAKRSQSFASALKLPLITLKKNRDLASGKITYQDFSQNLEGKRIISFDDFVSTGSSRIKAASLVKKLGAKYYVDCITHGLLGLDSSQKIQKSKIDKMYLSNSYPVPKNKRVEKIEVLDCSKILAKAIRKVISCP